MEKVGLQAWLDISQETGEETELWKRKLCVARLWVLDWRSYSNLFVTLPYARTNNWHLEFVFFFPLFLRCAIQILGNSSDKQAALKQLFVESTNLLSPTVVEFKKSAIYLQFTGQDVEIKRTPEEVGV